MDEPSSPAPRSSRIPEVRSRAWVALVALMLALAVGVVDVLTGPRLSLSIFYLIPVLLSTWWAGRRAGVCVALACALVWSCAEVATGLLAATSPILLWNTVVRFAVLYVVVRLLSSLRSALEEQQRATEAEARTAVGLKDLNEVKDALLRAISHDLRGPLTAILGSAQTLQRSDELHLSRDESDAMLSAIAQSARKLNRTLNDLVDLERIGTGHLELTREPADLLGVVQRTVTEADYLDEHPVRIEGDRLEADVDVAKVERILENLLRNAAKHTAAGTAIHVRVRPMPDGAVLAVEDEGPGVPEAIRASIFEPFRQGADARASGSGLGIGLSLVAKFAEMHGGGVVLRDRPGGGTIFEVRLPGGPSRPDRERAPSRAVAAPASS